MAGSGDAQGCAGRELLRVEDMGGREIVGLPGERPPNSHRQKENEIRRRSSNYCSGR